MKVWFVKHGFGSRNLTFLSSQLGLKVLNSFWEEVSPLLQKLLTHV